MQKTVINQNIGFTARGSAVEAVYLEPQLADYENNPLLLALPPIMTTDQAIERLAYLPKFEESVLALPDHLRQHKLNGGLRFFSPLDVHIDLEQRFSNLIRAGYIERNPLKHEFYKKIDQAINSFSQYVEEDNYSSTKYHGFNIVGISGVGKTQTVERILGLYPQVIRHSSFQGKNFTSSQLVWLKLDCPFDGSTKGLCLNFFQAVDRIFGTNYSRKYGKHKTTDDMLPYMALVASLHFLGVLVIDEIQRLSLAKSGGAEKMLNFFTQMVNSVGVPVVLVGTFKALPLLSNDFSQMRRGTGQGDLVWDRMGFDEQWETFIASLWDYQYTKKKVALGDSSPLSRVLYDETQGVTDLAIKTFIFAQQRAIETGSEKITAGIIRSVVHDKFKILRPALEAMRSKDKRALDLYEDIYPSFRNGFPAGSFHTSIVGELKRSPEIQRLSAAPSALDNDAAEVQENTESSIATTSGRESKVIPFKNSAPVSAGVRKERVLPELVRKAESKRVSGYEALLESGYIRSGDEFLRGGLA